MARGTSENRKGWEILAVMVGFGLKLLTGECRLFVWQFCSFCSPMNSKSFFFNVRSGSWRCSCLKLLFLTLMAAPGLLLGQTIVGLDPAQNWIGYMNVFNLPASAGGDGAYQNTNSGAWATADLTASFSGSTLTLGPNHINDPSAYWYVGGGQSGAAGNKIMDANMYVQNDTLAGQTLTFAAHTVSNTLGGTLPSWEVPGVQPFTTVAFIKDFDANYNLVHSTNIALTAGADFSLTLVTTPGDHVQYGFETVGPDIWSTDVSQVGTVVLTPLTNGNVTSSSSLLINSGFELNPAGESQAMPGWNVYGPNVFGETDAAVAHDGSHYLKIFQDFSAGGVNYSGVYQDYISGPGTKYQADGWAESLAADQLAGQNAAWLEVTFRDADANVLALYRSAIITNLSMGTFPVSAWIHLNVTNQCDPNTGAVIHTVDQLVAPAGTFFVRVQTLLRGDGNGSGGSVYFDDLQLTPAGGAPYGDWNIVWDDEFNGTNINSAVWTYDIGAGGWGNSELEYYTSRTNNAYEAGGCLHIVAQSESYHSSSFTSARLKSQGLFSCKYGRIEWRAKLPQGVGCWPALWLLGTNITSVGWPACGEIDVMENNGSDPLTVQASLHSGSDETGYYHFYDAGAAAAFHTYTLDWSTNALRFYVDGHLYEAQTSWSSSGGDYPFPFNQPFFFIMNLAVGGNYVGNPSANDINAGTSFPAEMQVDYVRIYQPTAPLILSMVATNSSLRLNWPNNIIGHLQTQLGAAGFGAGTNWFDTTITSNPAILMPTNPAMFFRVASP